MCWPASETRWGTALLLSTAALSNTFFPYDERSTVVSSSVLWHSQLQPLLLPTHSRLKFTRMSNTRSPPTSSTMPEACVLMGPIQMAVRETRSTSPMSCNSSQGLHMTQHPALLATAPRLRERHKRWETASLRRAMGAICGTPSLPSLHHSRLAHGGNMPTWVQSPPGSR